MRVPTSWKTAFRRSGSCRAAKVFNPKLPLSARCFYDKHLSVVLGISEESCMRIKRVNIRSSASPKPCLISSIRNFKVRTALSALGRVVYQSEVISALACGHPQAGAFAFWFDRTVYPVFRT